MKVLLVNGSPHKNGCTYTALCEIKDTLLKNGVESEIFNIGTSPVRGCAGCGGCAYTDGKCVFDDDIVNTLIEKAKTADAFIFASPVHYASPAGALCAVLDRVFYAGGKYFAYKPGAAVVSCRRSGSTASLDVLNKYFLINNMPVVSSQYWNMVHGAKPEDVLKDEEGLQIMRTLAKNTAWLLKCIEAGEKDGISIPEKEPKKRTNFIR